MPGRFSLSDFLVAYGARSAFIRRKAEYTLILSLLLCSFLLAFVLVRLLMNGPDFGLLWHSLGFIAAMAIVALTLFTGKLVRTVDLLILMLTLQCAFLLPKEVSRVFFVTVVFSLTSASMAYVRPYQRRYAMVVFPGLVIVKGVLEYWQSVSGALSRSTLEETALVIVVMTGFIPLVRYLTGVIDRDILYSETLRDINRDLRSQLLTDELTGASNRCAYEQAMRREMSRARRGEESLGLLFFDVDYFKAINDRHGHAAGDEVLSLLAATVSSMIRGSDYFFRWGGDEFAVLFIASRADGALDLAENVRRRIKENGRLSEYGCTISGGMAWYRNGDTPATMLQRADHYLYTAKERGRDRIVGDAPLA